METKTIAALACLLVCGCISSSTTSTVDKVSRDTPLRLSVREAAIVHKALRHLRAGEIEQCRHFLEANLDVAVCNIGEHSHCDRNPSEKAVRQRRFTLNEIKQYWKEFGRDFAYAKDSSTIPLAMRRNAAQADEIITEFLKD